MLNAADNEALTRVGPGTPMGSLMRQYWLPALLSRELPGPDSDPVRVLLLGERLIAFRNSNGQVGLLANHCPHRGASLFFGRNEEGGLRCVNHGWKFAADGTCVDMPNEPLLNDLEFGGSRPQGAPAESVFRTRVKANAYPTRERGGVVWAYLGPLSEPPALPDIEANMLPDDQARADAVQRECNWLQALEGDIDTSHLGFLHMGALDPDTMEPGTFGYYTVKDRRPHYQLVDTDGGTMYGAYRPAEPPMDYWRIAQFLFPCYALIPGGVLGREILTRAWVPMDDTHTMYFNMGAPGTTRGMDFSTALPNSTDWYGRFRLPDSAATDYGVDRARQRRRLSYTGLSSIHLEDQAITESMGAVLDRSKEHLGAADAMVIRTRRRLLDAVRALAEHGTPPPGALDPTVYRARSGSVFLPRGVDWIEATRELRAAFVEHPELEANPKLTV
jgi:phenylpropionate dioxygenase-like ring-hydroxylating dioxygenase large terminal subunit